MPSKQRNPNPWAFATTTDAPYPRPQFRRKAWTSLDGPWAFAYDDDDRFQSPRDMPGQWTHTIQVPFAPEAERSGVHDTGFHRVCWYQREFVVATNPGERVLLHFGAVDYAARVFVNEHLVGEHEGGHTPFSFDVSAALTTGTAQTVTVRVEDDPADLAKPRGKQDWQREPHSIWYPRTTGIWQTVWLEVVPQTYVDRVRWTPHLERWEIGFEAFLGGRRVQDAEIRLQLSVGDHVLVNDVYQVISGTVHRRIALSDPGIDDFRNELLWSPEKPTLIRAEIELRRDGQVIDAVESYTALRSVSIQRDYFMLNGRPYFMRLVLDQGYWPETLMSAPDSGALRRDIELAKAMGFNGVRKHQKIEDPRYLFWADVLGLLVWEEMPSAYRFTHQSVERMTREWTEVIDRDYNHPCIVVWVPFNESWGVPDLEGKPAHRSAVQALYHLTKTLDPTRPVIGNDGWENSTTDILSIHDYDNEPRRFRDRYDHGVPVAELLGGRCPAGRMVTVEGYTQLDQPIMLTEFGGIALALRERDGHAQAWGYAIAHTARDLYDKYRTLLESVHHFRLFRGFCYTQLTDTFQEANGLLFADRTPKVPLSLLAAATRGQKEERGAEVNWEQHVHGNAHHDMPSAPESSPVS